MVEIFFILGAGASRDSDLPTYRGPEGFYTDKDEDPSDVLNPWILKNDPMKVWDFITPLYQKIKDVKNHPGPTYQILKKIGSDDRFEGSFILTQNVDGLALSTNLPVIEIHGNMRKMWCMECGLVKDVNLGNLFCDCKQGNNGYFRPDIVLFNEPLSKYECEKVYRLIKGRPKYVVIVGTTLQFPYLRHLIGKAKKYGGKVVHINPDDNYKPNIRNNEEWIKENSEDGLTKFLERFNDL